MAAAALTALTNSIPQLPRVHALTKFAASRLKTLGYSFSLPVQTNMVVIDTEASGIAPAAFVSYCKADGVTVFPGRLVFHYQTTTDAVDRLIDALAKLMEEGSGKDLDGGKVTGGCS